ncbi:hypothetical protein AgCh_006106 [Apium graveolens]
MASNQSMRQNLAFGSKLTVIKKTQETGLPTELFDYNTDSENGDESELLCESELGEISSDKNGKNKFEPESEASNPKEHMATEGRTKKQEDQFTKYNIENNDIRAKCKHCG